MILRRSIISLLLLFCSFGIFAQHQLGICGNTYEDQMSQIERYLANKKVAKTISAQSRNVTTYIPLQFHIATRNDGSGAVQFDDLLEQFCHLNNQFSEFDVGFFQSAPPIVINSDVIFSNHATTSAQFTMRRERNREALNVWLVDDATPSATIEVGIILGYYDPINDWIVMRRNQISPTNNTLAHEIGHFFSLFHPHLGWDSQPYEMSIHGNPVTATTPGGGSTELVDRSNCETAGDMLCDTPPDYNFALLWNGCNFTPNIQDPNGDAVDPDESLIMSYFDDDCTSRFTDSQVGMMLADIASPSRNFLRINDYVPLAEVITETPRLLAPIGDAVTSTFNKVFLQWEPVTGADSYLVEVDRSSSFNIDNFKFITTSTTFLVDNLLDADRNYRWRVTPLNASYTCAPPSETVRFRTGLSTSVSDISSIDNWEIRPNLISGNQTIFLSVNAEETFDATINVYNLSGQLVQSVVNQQFPTGNSTLAIETRGLARGIYLVSLENQQGVSNKKLVVQ